MATNKCPNGHAYNINIFGDKCPFCIENSYKRTFQCKTNDTYVANYARYLMAEEWAETTKAEYQFVGSSTPSEHHRSYTISISAVSKTIKIDCYGSALLEKTYPSSLTEFEMFKASLAEMGMFGHEEMAISTCGGSKECIRLFKNDACFFDGYAYHSYPEDEGNLYLPPNVPLLFCAAIPENVEDLVQSTREII